MTHEIKSVIDNVDKTLTLLNKIAFNARKARNSDEYEGTREAKRLAIIDNLCVKLAFALMDFNKDYGYYND